MPLPRWSEVNRTHLRLDDRGYDPVLPRFFKSSRKVVCGSSTSPTIFMRRLPAFCFSSSFILRVTSPPYCRGPPKPTSSELE